MALEFSSCDARALTSVGAALPCMLATAPVRGEGGECGPPPTLLWPDLWERMAVRGRGKCERLPCAVDSVFIPLLVSSK